MEEVSKQRLLDERYLRMARIWSENSYCKRRQVGALIVKDKSIISDGYNGTPSGFENLCEDENDKTKPYVLHAEANAITKVAKSGNSSDRATLYVTASPCIEYAKLIIQAAEVGYLTAKQALERLWKGISPTLTNKRKEMYAKYDFRKKPSSKEDEDKQPLYPRIVSNGTIDFQRIVKEIAQASSFTPADIEGVQLAIENKISEYLISGYHVQLGDLGYFSAKLKARPVMDAKRYMRSPSISTM